MSSSCSCRRKRVNTALWDRPTTSWTYDSTQLLERIRILSYVRDHRRRSTVCTTWRAWSSWRSRTKGERMNRSEHSSEESRDEGRYTVIVSPRWSRRGSVHPRQMIDEGSLDTCTHLREELKDRRESAKENRSDSKETHLSKDLSETHQLWFNSFVSETHRLSKRKKRTCIDTLSCMKAKTGESPAVKSSKHSTSEPHREIKSARTAVSDIPAAMRQLLPTWSDAAR